jgi:hypothetical protein
MCSQLQCRHLVIEPEGHGRDTYPEPDTQKITLRTGLEMFIGDDELTRYEKILYDTPENVCDLVFFLSGKVDGWCDGFSGKIETWPLLAAMWLTPRMQAAHERFPGARVRYVCIRIYRPLLVELMGSFLREAPEDFRLVLENQRDCLYYCLATMTIPMQAAVRQIFQCPYRKDMKRLFLESKAL